MTRYPYIAVVKNPETPGYALFEKDFQDKEYESLILMFWVKDIGGDESRIWRGTSTDNGTLIDRTAPEQALATAHRRTLEEARRLTARLGITHFDYTINEQ